MLLSGQWCMNSNDCFNPSASTDQNRAQNADSDEDDDDDDYMDSNSASDIQKTLP